MNTLFMKQLFGASAVLVALAAGGAAAHADVVNSQSGQSDPGGATTTIACLAGSTMNLTVGSQGAAVRNLQTLLNRDGETVPVTGYFGVLTKAAVMAFQLKHQLPYATGYAGPLTRAKLEQLYPCTAVIPEPVFPLCAQPPMPACPNGYVCSMVMPAPRTYTNLAQYTNDKATFLYSGPCAGDGVNPTTISITTATLPAATVGTEYAASIETAGGTSDFGWGVIAGNLPPGVRFAQIQCITTPCPTWSSTARLVGAPSLPGTYAFTVRFTAGGQVTTKRFSIVVRPESETETSPQVGGVLDYNDDRAVDQSDVQYLLDVAVAARSCPEGRTCDINGDGKTLASDALMLAKYVGTASSAGTLDYNNDLKLNTADAATLLSVSVGTISCPAGKVCDLDGKDGVDATDARMLLVYVGQ